MDSSPPQKVADKTRRQIVKAAEKLFAEKGFRAMTLRDVTKAARVNLAAVNYHFGSKTNLMRAVIQRRIDPINSARLERLDKLVAQHAPAAIPLEHIFEALFRPMFEHSSGAKGNDLVFMQMVGRALTEPADFMRAMHKEFFAELSRRFLTELKRACPELSEQQLELRFFLSVSTMLGTISDQVLLESISDGKLNSQDLDTICNELTSFTVAGFQQG